MGFEVLDDNFKDEQGVKRPYTKGMKWFPWVMSMRKHVIALSIQMTLMLVFVITAIVTRDEFYEPFWFWFLLGFMLIFGILCWVRVWHIWYKCWKLENRNHGRVL